MKHIVCSFSVFLLLAAFPLAGYGLIMGEWEFADSLSFKPKGVCVDGQDRKWFMAADGLWAFDNSIWTRYPMDVPNFSIGSVNSMEAVGDSSIWIGTRFDGALCFDGTVWHTYSVSNSGIGSNKVKGIASDGAGGMWFATAKHASFLKDNSWRIYPIGTLLPEGAELTCVAVDRQGRVWFGTNANGLLRLNGPALQKYSENSDLTVGNIRFIRVFTDGRMAVGGSAGVSILENDSWKTVSVPSIEYAELDDSGNMWFGNVYGLWCYDGDIAVHISRGNFPISNETFEYEKKIYGMALDHSNNLWFATGKGVYRFSGRFIQILQPEYTQIDEAPVMYEGTTVSIAWMAARVDQVALDYSLDGGSSWNSIAPSLKAKSKYHDWTIPFDFLPQGFLSGIIRIRVSDRNQMSLYQTVYIRAEKNGFRNGMSKLTPDNSGLASGTVRAMVEDPGGVLWFATDKGVSRFDGSGWQTLTSGNSGLVSDDIHDCALGPDGSLWFGTASGISRYSDGVWKAWLPGKFTVKIKTGGDAVWAVCADSLSFLYRNPVNPVLYRLKGDSWIPFRTVDGDTLKDFSQIQVDRTGNAWLVRILPPPEFPTCNPPPDQFLRCDGERWEIISMDGLNNHYRIQNFIFDTGNILWGMIGSEGWLASFDGNTWTSYSGPYDGFPGMEYYLTFDTDNVLWCASENGIYSFDGTRWVFWKSTQGWPRQEIGNIHGLLVDRRKVKWILTSWGVFRFDDSLVPVEEEKTRPEKFAITGNFPNPFNPSTTISFTLPAYGRASLSIYSITGQKVRELISAPLSAGAHIVRWDGKDASGKPVSSGVYFSRLEAGGRTATGKMALVR